MPGYAVRARGSPASIVLPCVLGNVAVPDWTVGAMVVVSPIATLLVTNGDLACTAIDARTRLAQPHLGEEPRVERAIDSAQSRLAPCRPWDTTRALQRAAGDPAIDPGSNFLGLARSAAGLRRGRPRRALWSGDERCLRADAGPHGYRVRLDGICAIAGARADVTGHWLKILKSDNRAIFSAASLASKAVDYLFDLQQK